MNSMHPGILPRQRELDGAASFLFWCSVIGIPAIALTLILTAPWWAIILYLLALFFTY